MSGKVARLFEAASLFLLLFVITPAVFAQGEPSPIDFGWGSPAQKPTQSVEGKKYIPERAPGAMTRSVDTSGVVCPAVMHRCPNGTAVPLLSQNNCQAVCGNNNGVVQSLPGGWQEWANRKGRAAAERRGRIDVADSGNMNATTSNSHTVGGVSFDVSPSIANIDSSTNNLNNINTFTANPVFTVSSSGQGSGQSGSMTGQSGGGEKSCAALGSTVGSAWGPIGTVVGGIAGSFLKC